MSATYSDLEQECADLGIETRVTKRWGWMTAHMWSGGAARQRGFLDVIDAMLEQEPQIRMRRTNAELRTPVLHGWRDSLVMRLAGHDHWDPRRVHHGPTDRAQQHAGKSAAAMATHHHELGVCRLREQSGCGPIADHDLVDCDIGIPVLPSA